METDIFKRKDLLHLIKGKQIVFLGDSNVRALYKDFLVLLQEDKLISDSHLKSKMEESFAGDILTYHGKKYNGRDYREQRLFHSNEHNLSFFYLTRIYDSYMKGIFQTEIVPKQVDIVFVNSCLWDISRWGPEGIEAYKKNLYRFVDLLERSLSPKCLVVWLTAPPLSQEIRGGFLVPQLQFLEHTLRYHVAEANHYAAKVFRKAGYDVVDVHYYLTKFLRWRTKDGIHWFPPVVRYLTNRLLTHVSLAWGVELPYRKRRAENSPLKIDERFNSTKWTCTDVFQAEERPDPTGTRTESVFEDCMEFGTPEEFGTPTQDEQQPIETHEIHKEATTRAGSLNDNTHFHNVTETKSYPSFTMSSNVEDQTEREKMSKTTTGNENNNNFVIGQQMTFAGDGNNFQNQFNAPYGWQNPPSIVQMQNVMYQPNITNIGTNISQQQFTQKYSYGQYYQYSNW